MHLVSAVSKNLPALAKDACGVFVIRLHAELMDIVSSPAGLIQKAKHSRESCGFAQTTH